MMTTISTNEKSLNTDPFVLDWYERPIMQRPLTKSDLAIWEYYQSLNKDEFYRSLKRIAEDTGVNEKTVRRANDQFKIRGWLDWFSGHGNSKAGSWGETNRY